MTPEKHDNKLTRWLLMATMALLALVLVLQLWQMFGKTAPGNVTNAPSLTRDAFNPEPPQTAAPALSSGKAAMIEDVRALNPDLSADDLAKLSAQELEQLWETGAPGLPIGVSAAAQAAEEYAGTLAVDSVTSETDPELDEAPAHYEVELRHPTLGDFEYKIDAYTGEVLEGLPNILQSVQAAGAPQQVPDASSEPQAPSSAAQAPAASTQTPSAAAQAPAASAQPPSAAAQAPAASAQTPSSAAQAPAASTQTPSSAAQAPAASGEEAAKNAAFTHAGVSAADAKAIRCKLDWDNGRQVYDIEFWVGNTEYDYEIDASTNAVLEAKQEQNAYHGGTAAQQPGSFIGEEAAKSAALTHAGVSAANAGYIKCELDEDDGRWVYELEFRVGGVEYDYEVDASSGTVVKAEQDR